MSTVIKGSLDTDGRKLESVRDLRAWESGERTRGVGIGEEDLSAAMRGIGGKGLKVESSGKEAEEAVWPESSVRGGVLVAISVEETSDMLAVAVVAVGHGVDAGGRGKV